MPPRRRDHDLEATLNEFLAHPDCDAEALAGAWSMLKRGYTVVPVEPGAKKPLVSYDEQTRDPLRLLELAKREIEARHPQAWGIVPQGGDLVLDRDRADDPSWLAALPPTLTVRRGDHEHRYYRVDPAVASRNGARVDDVDVKMVCHDGQPHSLVVAPGTRHVSGERYQLVVDREVATLDLAKVPRRDHAKVPTSTTTRHGHGVSEAEFARAVALAERMPPSVEGHGGDQALLRVATELATVLGADADVIELVLREVYNPRCRGPWPPAKLRREATRAAARFAELGSVGEWARGRRDATVDASAAADANYALIDLVDRSRPPRQLDYLVPGLGLAPGKVSVIQAYANVAKTPFALLLALCVAAGIDFLEFPVKQAPTLFLAFEGEVLAEEREARLCAGLGLSRVDVPFSLGVPRQSLGPPLLDELEQLVRERNIGLVIIDTYTSALDATVDHNSSQFSGMLRELGRLSDATNCVVLALMHENKSDNHDSMRGISGHNTAGGAIQAAIRLSRRSEDRNVIDVSCTREPRNGFAPFAIQFEDVPCPEAPTGDALVVHRIAATPKGRAPNGENRRRHEIAQVQSIEVGERIIARMREVEPRFGGGYLPRKELHALAGAGRNKTDAVLAKLVDAGLMTVRGSAYALTAAGAEATSLAIKVAVKE